MDQYRPCFRAHRIPVLARAATQQEYRKAVELAQSHGLRRLDHRRRLALV